MASPGQSGALTTIHITHTLEAYQLLELHPGLLPLIESGSIQSLYLKSAVASNAAAQEAAQPTAVICSSNQTFELRQAQSSNSLYVLKSSESEDAAIRDFSGGITAIAQCKAALELLPISPNATAYLGHILPVYHGPDATEPLKASSSLLPRASLLADAPFSAAEFDQGWLDLCVFTRNDAAYRPSEAAKLSLWRSFCIAADVVGVNLKATFKVADLAGLLEEEGYETAFLEAMLRRMTAGGQLNGDVTIDPAKCVRWLGQVVLLNAGPEGLPEHEFVSRWSGSLPDPWKDEAQIMSGLDASDYVKQGDRIVFAQRARFESAFTTEGSEQHPAKAQNKWHSKFAK